MTKELINKENEFQILFVEINGGGWLKDIENIVNINIKPNSINKNIISSTWHEMEAELIFTKDNLNAKIEIDDIGNISLLTLDITEESKQKLREYATIIAQEIEKLKK